MNCPESSSKSLVVTVPQEWDTGTLDVDAFLEQTNADAALKEALALAYADSHPIVREHGMSVEVREIQLWEQTNTGTGGNQRRLGEHMLGSLGHGGRSFPPTL